MKNSRPKVSWSTGPIQGLPGLLEPIHSEEIYTYARLRCEGHSLDVPLQAGIDQPRVNPRQDLDVEPLEPLVTAPQPAEFVDLAEKGFAREPRQLLVLVKWPDQVTAFLVPCDQLV